MNNNLHLPDGTPLFPYMVTEEMELLVTQAELDLLHDGYQVVLPRYVRHALSRHQEAPIPVQIIQLDFFQAEPPTQKTRPESLLSAENIRRN